ncbi:MAG: excisionase family DNA-binding protein [Thiogranum sp.]|nr:excisionase family DNA-binding protein [Thiogranum sp.]
MNEVCTTRQAAERLGVSLRTIQLWVESGVLKAWKTAGGHRRVARDSVEALVKQKRAALNGGTAPALKILVMEQDTDIVEGYRSIIGERNLPAEVITAGNIVEGLTLLGRHDPDVFIFDLESPGLDGLEMIRILRGNPEHDGMSIVITSSLDADEIDRRGGLPDNVIGIRRPIPGGALETLLRDKLGCQPESRAASPG